MRLDRFVQLGRPLAVVVTLLAACGGHAQDVLVVVGAPGEPSFAAGFSSAADAIQRACAANGIPCQTIGLAAANGDRADHDRDRVVDWMPRLRQSSTLPAWLIYIGHGTWDGQHARLNLRGPDLDAATLREALEGQRRPFVFVHGGAASAPFIPLLSGPDRVIVTATESGDEVNYARFGEQFAAAIVGAEADTDRDGRTSLLEATIFAARRVQTFYDEAGRMATEHAMIDDNGDGKGTPAGWFRGTRVERTAEGGAEPDGALAHRFALIESAFERSLTEEQRLRRARLERDLEELRRRKADLESTVYFRELERILRELAPIYAEPGDPPPDT